MEGAHRRDEPDRAAGAARSASAARSSATVRIVLMPAARRPRASARRVGERVEERRAGRASRSATAARWRATVASSPRAIGPVSARCGAAARPSSRRVARTSGTSSCAVDAGGRGEALGGALERDEEVRGDRGGGVVGGAVLVGDLDRAHAERARRARVAAAQRARGACRRRRAPAPANGAAPRRRSRSSAGAGRSPRGRRGRRALWRPSSGRRAARGRDRRGRRGDLAVGDAQQDDVGARRRRAAAERAPTRARPRAARRRAPCRAGRRRRSRSAGRVSAGVRSSSRMEIPAASAWTEESRSVPRRLTAVRRMRSRCRAGAWLPSSAWRRAAERREALKAVWQQAQRLHALPAARRRRARPWSSAPATPTPT